MSIQPIDHLAHALACNGSEDQIISAAVAKINAMKPVFEVETRSVFGNTTIYPVNEVAKAIAAIAGTTTLRPKDLVIARDVLGFVLIDRTPVATVLHKLGVSRV